MIKLNINTYYKLITNFSYWIRRFFELGNDVSIPIKDSGIKKFSSPSHENSYRRPNQRGSILSSGILAPFSTPNNVERKLIKEIEVKSNTILCQVTSIIKTFTQ